MERKTREVSTAVPPFQTLEHIDEPRKEAREDEELALDLGGRQVKGWTNKLIWGDNRLILSSLKAGALRRQIEDAGGLKLIYIDPPFDVGADFSMDIEIGGETFHKEPNLLEQIACRDTWGARRGFLHRHDLRTPHPHARFDGAVVLENKPFNCLSKCSCSLTSPTRRRRTLCQPRATPWEHGEIYRKP